MRRAVLAHLQGSAAWRLPQVPAGTAFLPASPAAGHVALQLVLWASVSSAIWQPFLGRRPAAASCWGYHPPTHIDGIAVELHNLMVFGERFSYKVIVIAVILLLGMADAIYIRVFGHNDRRVASLSVSGQKLRDWMDATTQSSARKRHGQNPARRLCPS